ncbi:hypothetical protein Tco_0926146 [Tanacetum coccineum]|uniref:Uncharacterized protein n=1 Tax=Tanacetum coccineum TaxID=301880 RepID=A0ABQ5D9U2_9ASTR
MAKLKDRTNLYFLLGSDKAFKVRYIRSSDPASKPGMIYPGTLPLDKYYSDIEDKSSMTPVMQCTTLLISTPDLQKNSVYILTVINTFLSAFLIPRSEILKRVFLTVAVASSPWTSQIQRPHAQIPQRFNHDEKLKLSKSYPQSLMTSNFLISNIFVGTR